MARDEIERVVDGMLGSLPEEVGVDGTEKAKGSEPLRSIKAAGKWNELFATTIRIFLRDVAVKRLGEEALADLEMEMLDVYGEYNGKLGDAFKAAMLKAGVEPSEIYLDV